MRKNRPDLLAEFTKHLFERDPMGICFTDNPDRENEYDGEALSILSRFVESQVVSMPGEQAHEVAYYVVQGAFEFWFGAPLRDEAAAHQLAAEMLDILRAAYPEQAAVLGVGSADEESSGDGGSGLSGITPGQAPPEQG